MEPQCKSSGAGASASSRKKSRAGGASSRRRHERRRNACHLLPGFTVLDVPLGHGKSGQNQTQDHPARPNLNQQGWETIKALVSASNRAVAGQPCRARGPWGTQDSGRAARLARLTPRSLPALGSPVERGPWKDLTGTCPTHRHSLWVHAHLEPTCSVCPHSTHRQADCNCTWSPSVQALLSLRRPQQQHCQSRLEAKAQTL